MKVVIDVDDNVFARLFDEGTEDYEISKDDLSAIIKLIRKGVPLTPSLLADMLMEERISGRLNYDAVFDQDITYDVKCRLTVSIIDHRPCYCGAELREVWRESGEAKENSETNDIKDLSRRIENIERQMREDKEEQIKKLKAEIEYAKFRCGL